MDRDGMLGAPGEIKCRGCGKGLDADGGHPAERYAGTFTGLCYGCEGGPAFDTGKREASGAEVWSHPPHAPSWRRDRQTYVWFHDCSNPRCQHGRTWISRSDPQGGSYTVNCPACWKRHFEHPATIEEAARLKRCADAVMAWQARVAAEYTRRCLAEGLDPATMHKHLADAVLAAAPARPTGEECPEFPQGWAVPETKKGRRSRAR